MNVFITILLLSATSFAAITFTDRINNNDTIKLLELSIVHINDFHARFEETAESGGVCKKNEKCIGGFSRMYAQIVEILKNNPDSVLLNAGDNFQGTLWYSLFKWNVTQYFMNKLKFDAYTIGNHEFDDGISGIVPFLQALDSKVVISNINDNDEPTIQNTYSKSTIINRNGQKIGIIGIITSNADQIAMTGNLKFYNELESVNAEAERLVREHDVFTNIVLSHCGYNIEQNIAQNSRGKISLVVGGHSHSFLHSGEGLAGPDKVEGPYPTRIKNIQNKTVLVVQAAAFAKYVGNISISYDETRNVIKWSGAPIYLDSNLPQDEMINAELEPWKQKIDSIGNEIVGSTLVKLNQKDCFQSECLLGNFVTDAMVFAYTSNSDKESWTYASIAICNSGGLRNEIQMGNITYNDLVTAQPFENTIDVIEIEGKYIKETLEYTVSPNRYFSGIYLLQVSGLHLTYNLSKPVGSRVVSINVRCQNCKIPIYKPIDLCKIYRVIVPAFLSRGGDGFSQIANNRINKKVGPVDIDVLQDYLKHRSPYFTEIEGRHTIIE